MAYTFDNIEEQLADQKQNIFQQPEGGAAPPQGTQSSEDYFKTPDAPTFEGGGLQSASAMTPTPSAAPQQYSRASVFKRNLGNVGKPRAFENIEKGLMGATGALEREATKYVQRANQAGQEYAPSAVGKLKKLKTNAFAYSGGLEDVDEEELRKFVQSGTPEYGQDFTPQTQTDFFNAKDYQSPGFLTQGQGSGRYIPKNLDFTLLQQDPAYQKDLRAYGREQSLVNAEAKDIKDLAGEYGTKFYKDSVNESRKGAVDWLTKANMDTVGVGNAILEGLQRDDPTRVGGAGQQAVTEAADAIAGEDPALRPYLDEVRGGFSYDPYVTSGLAGLTPLSVLNPEQAQAFNSMAGILGSGEIAKSLEGVSPKVDKAGIAAALKGGAINKRDKAAADKAAQAAAAEEMARREAEMRGFPSVVSEGDYSLPPSDPGDNPVLDMAQLPIVLGRKIQSGAEDIAEVVAKPSRAKIGPREIVGGLKKAGETFRGGSKPKTKRYLG